MRGRLLGDCARGRGKTQVVAIEEGMDRRVFDFALNGSKCFRGELDDSLHKLPFFLEQVCEDGVGFLGHSITPGVMHHTSSVDNAIGGVSPVDHHLRDYEVI